MPSEHPFPDGTDIHGERPWLPTGPALLYVTSSGTNLLQGDQEPLAWRVDSTRITEGGTLSADDARRERMLLRALLNHALFLLGPEEREY